MVLGNIARYIKQSTKEIKHYSLITLASFSFACSNCNNDSLSKVPCKDYEICGNYDDRGQALDDNCNGFADEECNNDGDGFCGANVFWYKTGQELSICPETFRDCTPERCMEGEYDCRDLANYTAGGRCEHLKYDCDDLRDDIYPYAEEKCDGQDNDCNGEIDDNFPEKGDYCDPDSKLGERILLDGELKFEKDGVGICKAGIYTECKNGQKICSGYVGPKDREYCNGLDDDCDPETLEDFLTDVIMDNTVRNEASCYTGPPGTAGKGVCLSGILFCKEGKIGGDGICYGEQTPTTEQCDCYDNDCDNEVDEGMNIMNGDLQIAIGIDTSLSMAPFFPGIQDSLSSIKNPLFCMSERVHISTIAVGDLTSGSSIPALKRSLATVEEFAREFSNDIPGTYGSSIEPTLNTVIYTACDLLDRKGVAELLCEQIRPINSLKADHQYNNIRKPVFNLEGEKIMILFTDETAQWYIPRPYISLLPTQEDAARLAAAAGITVIVYTVPSLDNLENCCWQGYGYFREYGGDVRVIGNVDAKEDLEQLILLTFCESK